MNRASNTGLMTIRLTRDNRFPAAGVEVQLTDGNKIYNTVTDQNGRASFNVETPPFYTSQIVSPAAQPFTQVNILISAPGYVSVRVVNLMVFPLTETTFTQNMILLAGSPYGSVRTVVIPTHHLARTPLGELPQAPEREAAPIPTVAETDDEGNVYNRRVIVPEYITVHMGPPSSDAQNITVPYLYYLKSVASSEIYPPGRPRRSRRTSLRRTRWRSTASTPSGTARRATRSRSRPRRPTTSIMYTTRAFSTRFRCWWTNCSTNTSAARTILRPSTRNTATA